MKKSSETSFQISGLNEVDDALRQLAESVQKRIVNDAAREAMEPVVEEAKRMCPKDTGNLAESIGIKRPKMRGRLYKGVFVLSVGPRKGFEWAYEGASRDNKPFKYGIPVEYGHVAPGGNFVPPVSFMRNAYLNQREAIVERFASSIKEKIEDATERARRKAGA